MGKQERKIELLSPAGNKEQFIASIENGADAVYVGGTFLNAREAAEGLDDEEMERAVKYAHVRGARVYVTMNTLVKESELEEGLRYAKKLYEMGVDALIIQDLGLGRYIHRRIPKFELHLSTQNSIYGASGVRAAGELGYKRVVLARELSLKEIRSACNGSGGTEIEVFCHGALCVCWSGQCQLSRYNGGRSGNRGACAQPCRLMYRTATESGSVLTEGISDYPLSPKDLCLIDHIGDLIDCGVASLKIEGRMKSPEYAAVVTRIYRKYIDEYLENGEYEVSDEDKEELEQIFSRGHSEAYFSGIKDGRMMTSDIPKHQGVRIGKVVRRVDGEFIEIELDKDLEMGDGIEIHSRELTGNIVTYLKESGSSDGVRRFIVGDIKGKVGEGDAVYRTSSKKQLKEARRTFEGIDFDDDSGKRNTEIDLSMSISGDGLLLRAVTKDGIESECWRDIPEARLDEGSTDRFIKALGKTGSTPFTAGKIEISDEVAKLSMKVSEINDMRRQVLDQLKVRIGEAAKRESEEYEAPPEVVIPEPAKAKGTDEFWDGKGDGREKLELELYFDSWDDFSGFTVSEEARKAITQNNISITALLPLVDVIKNAAKLTRIKFKPYISNISKGREAMFLRENFDAVLAVCKQTGVYVGSLEWVRPLTEEGVTVMADFGLNVLNKQAGKAMEDLGVKYCAPGLDSVGKGAGRFPLMTLEHEPAGAEITDPLGRKYEIKRRDYSSQTIIKPSRDLSGGFEKHLSKLLQGQDRRAGKARIYI